VEDVEVDPGEAAALFRVEASSGGTQTDGKKVIMSSMHVSEPVTWLAVQPHK